RVRPPSAPIGPPPRKAVHLPTRLGTSSPEAAVITHTQPCGVLRRGAQSYRSGALPALGGRSGHISFQSGRRSECWICEMLQDCPNRRFRHPATSPRVGSPVPTARPWSDPPRRTLSARALGPERYLGGGTGQGRLPEGSTSAVC